MRHIPCQKLAAFALATVHYSEIQDPVVPLLAVVPTAGWALVNLILTISTVALSIQLVGSYILFRNDDEPTEHYLSNSKLKLVSIAPAIVAVVFFLHTSDMTTPMAWVNQWTLATMLITLMQVVILIKAHQNATTPDDFEDDYR